jgi:hypothetical protein
VFGERSAAPEAQNRHGGAPRGERPASWDARRLARRLTRRVMACPTGVSHAPERLSALRPPQNPRSVSAAHHSPSARAALRPGYERRPAFALVPPMSVAAHFGQTNPTAILAKRTQRVSLRSSPRKEAGTQDHGPVIMDPGSPPACAGVGRDDDRVGVTDQPLAVGNERRLGLPVSGLFFTGNPATSTCHDVASRTASSHDVIELMEDRGEVEGLLGDSAAVGRGIVGAGAVAVVARHRPHR